MQKAEACARNIDGIAKTVPWNRLHDTKSDASKTRDERNMDVNIRTAVFEDF